MSNSLSLEKGAGWVWERGGAEGVRKGQAERWGVQCMEVMEQGGGEDGSGWGVDVREGNGWHKNET